MEAALPLDIFRRLPLPWEAAFLAGKCFQQYRRKGGNKRSSLSDFYIGAHAAVSGLALLTRDKTRYQTYFPQRNIIVPIRQRPIGMDHLLIEERSIVLHRTIAQRIKENPALLDVARQNLRRWALQDGERSYWEEWEKLIEGPLGELLAFMVSPADKARWLRQSSPFCGILSPRERWKIYESFTA